MNWPDDLVSQLRMVSTTAGETVHERHPAYLCHKAADELDALYQREHSYRMALAYIAGRLEEKDDDRSAMLATIARMALQDV